MVPRRRFPKKSLRSSFEPALRSRRGLVDGVAAERQAIRVEALLFSAALSVFLCLQGFTAGTVRAQERGPAATSASDLRAAIDRLGSFDYPTRSKAARAVRRTAAAQAVPALLSAAREHKDSYVRYKSLVLLTGFADARTTDQMLEALDSPNDRLREVAYGYFERNPNPALIPRLLTALKKEEGEFVRPALVRALAALGDDPKVRDVLVADIMRGADHFRSTVIEALGDYKRTHALPRLVDVARLEGPLQDDAALALGKIGDKRALEVLAGLQRTGGRTLQPTLAAAICLLGVNCSSHLGYLQKVLTFADDNPGYQDMVRAASLGLDAVATLGNADAVEILFAAGIPSMDPIRAPLALSAAKVAMRNTPLLLKYLLSAPDRPGAISLLAEGFDMLQEDLEEERFFVAVRREYWTAPEGTPMRVLGEQLIGKLDF